MVEILERIEEALRAAEAVLTKYTPGSIAARAKAGGDPVTEADIEVNEKLHEILPRSGEGWLSEETRDDKGRLACQNVWVVDPIDGTREFVIGLPEWCISIGWVENGRAIAGGILNPAAGHLIIGSLETGVTLNGQPVKPRSTNSLADATVLASRSEVKRGEWEQYEDREFSVIHMGSVAYKLGRVAAGLNDATWTLVPKHEWDVAAGCALIEASGGQTFIPTCEDLVFNRPHPKLPGLVAFAAGVQSLWAEETFTLTDS
jgi:myo-inositol-1(or 4)-monophosphatase